MLGFSTLGQTALGALPTGAYRLTADAGTFTFTGTAAGFKRGYTLAAGSGIYAMTGTSAGLKRGYTLGAGAGSYALTGTAAGLSKGYTLSLGAGSYTLTGTAAQFVSHRSLSAPPGAFAVSFGTVLVSAFIHPITFRPSRSRGGFIDRNASGAAINRSVRSSINRNSRGRR